MGFVRNLVCLKYISMRRNFFHCQVLGTFWIPCDEVITERLLQENAEAGPENQQGHHIGYYQRETKNRLNIRAGHR